MAGAASVATLLVGLCSHQVGVAARNGDAARAFLVQELGLTVAEVRRVDAGGVVTKSMEPADRREVATQGVVQVGIDAATYLERLTDIVAFKRHEAVQQIGVFSEVPTAADLAGLTLERGDIRELRSCRVGDCGLKLSADAIERFEREVRWGSPEAEQQATALLRDVLARYVAEYRRQGDAAAMRYHAATIPVDAAAEFHALLTPDDHLLEQLPALTTYLRHYPTRNVEGVRDFIYWSREKAGPSPVVSITHVIMAPGAKGSAVEYAALSRQIYGSRYFDASMGLTLLLPDTSTESPSTFVAYLNRSRVDVFSGLFGGIVRRTVRSRVRSGMAESLARVRIAMQRPVPVEAR